MVCILLGYSTTTADQKHTGLFFIGGRFLGLTILGLIIALLGVIFYLLVLFGILTIVFGAFIIFKMYHRYKKHNLNSSANATTQQTQKDRTCSTNENEEPKFMCGHKRNLQIDTKTHKITRSYSFFLGIFRGATPCLKIIILAPLLIIVDLPLAFLMILVFTGASTIYPVIGFLAANVLKNFPKFDVYVQVTGAIILISVGVFTIFNHLSIHGISL